MFIYLPNLFSYSPSVRRISATLIAALALSSIPYITVANPNSGASCSKLGAQKDFQGKRFTCVKKKGKKVWNKGSRIASPTPSPSSPTSGALLSPSLPLEKCQIVETSTMRRNSGKFSGFPATESLFKHTGSIRFQVIPVDWSDLVGQFDFRNRISKQMNTFTEWMSMVSEEKISIKWTLHNSWIRLPGNSADYAVPFSEAAPQTSDFWRKAIPAVDPQIDFSNTDIAMFVFPLGQKIVPEGVQELYPSGVLKSNPPNEGNLKGFLAPGYRWDQDNIVIWSYLAHETGHLLDFAHMGTPRMGPQGDFRSFDVMGNQDSSRTFTGWWRFLAQWFDENQVYCQDSNNPLNETLELIPIDSPIGGLKLAVIRLSDSKALIIESRRDTKFYEFVGGSRSRDGVLAYEYNGNLGHLEDFFIPLAPIDSLEEYNWDGNTRYLMTVGDELQAGDIQIKVLSSGKTDRISIKKLGPTAPRRVPKPQSVPTPSTTDFNVVPTAFGGAIRTSPTTADSIWYGKEFNSFRVYVVSASSPDSKPMFDTGIINDYRSPINVSISGISCKGDELEVAIFYSGLNGQGKSKRIEQSAALSAANSNGTSDCRGYWNNNSVGSNSNQGTNSETKQESNPAISKGEVLQSGRLSAVTTWNVTNYNSYRLRVTTKNDPSINIFDTGLVDSSESPLTITTGDLVCGKELIFSITFYGEKGGRGLSQTIESQQLREILCN